MADIIRTADSLSLEAEFSDNDTRTITVANPKATVTAAQINELGDYCATNQVIIGDKAGADFSRFKSAKITRGQYIDYDLTTE